MLKGNFYFHSWTADFQNIILIGMSQKGFAAGTKAVQLKLWLFQYTLYMLRIFYLEADMDIQCESM